MHRDTDAHTHAHTHAQTHTHEHTHTHTHTHTYAQIHTKKGSEIERKKEKTPVTYFTIMLFRVRDQ